jgi:dTDP-4-dehydrorhamnose reductase
LRILLTGRNGQVGWELARALPELGEAIATDRASLDLADYDAIRRTVRETKPQIIINSGAYTAVDKAESEPGAAASVNAGAPAVLAEEAKRLGAFLVHYSTDYVFDGEKAGPYGEEDPTNPLNVYGRTKRDGELSVMEAGCRHLILRTSWVYGPRGRNFLLAIVRKARSGEALRVVDDQLGAPTSSRAIALGTISAISSAIRNDYIGGLYHMSAVGSTTWYGFARSIVRATGLHVEVEPISSNDYPAPARRPRNSVLDNSKITRELDVHIPSWEEGMTEVLAQLGKD